MVLRRLWVKAFIQFYFKQVFKQRFIAKMWNGDRKKDKKKILRFVATLYSALLLA